MATERQKIPKKNKHIDPLVFATPNDMLPSNRLIGKYI